MSEERKYVVQEFVTVNVMGKHALNFHATSASIRVDSTVNEMELSQGRPAIYPGRSKTLRLWATDAALDLSKLVGHVVIVATFRVMFETKGIVPIAHDPMWVDRIELAADHVELIESEREHGDPFFNAFSGIFKNKVRS